MTNLQNPTFKVEYIRNERRHDLEHGKVYEAFLPLDERRGFVIGITDEEGEQWGYPASWFKLISDPNGIVPETSTIHR